MNLEQGRQTHKEADQQRRQADEQHKQAELKLDKIMHTSRSGTIINNQKKIFRRCFFTIDDDHVKLLAKKQHKSLDIRSKRRNIFKQNY